MWWDGDGVWEKAPEDDEDDEDDEEPLRYEIHTELDGNISIFQLQGNRKISEGTATYSNNTVTCQIFGGEYSAEMDESGSTLTWSDGDQWTRVKVRRANAYHSNNASVLLSTCSSI